MAKKKSKHPDIIITQSMIKDWKTTPCPIHFREKWINKTIPWRESEPMLWGKWFEFQAIGGTAHMDEEGVPKLTEKMEKSVFYTRALEQVKMWHKIVKECGIENIIAQEYLEAEIVFEYNSMKLPVKIGGTTDLSCTMDGKAAIIDIKLTGNVKNTYGDFAWGAPETMNMIQPVHYTLLKKIQTGIDYDFYFLVFDISAAMGVKFYKTEIKPERYEYHEKDVFAVWNEIYYAMKHGFEPTPKFEICRDCPVKCEFEQTIPQIEIIEV